MLPVNKPAIPLQGKVLGNRSVFIGITVNGELQPVS